MRRSLILLFLAAVGGGGSYGAGITEVARDAGMTESSTWRWHVNSILTEQQKSDSLVSKSRHRPTSKPF